MLAASYLGTLLTDARFIALLCLGAFAVAYFVYARYISRAILSLDPARKTPAWERADGIDFVPTRRGILFGHHFVTIAGLGPILGPAVAVIWGWLPALLWVVFGTIFIGAVHDFSALVVSLRHQGRSIGDVLGDLAGPRARVLFLLIIFFALALAMGVFTLVLAALFVQFYPEVIIPVFGLMLLAMGVGYLIYRRRLPVLPLTLVGVLLMFLLIWAGIRLPVVTYTAGLAPADRAALDARMTPQTARTPVQAQKDLTLAGNQAERLGRTDDAAESRRLAAAVAAAAGRAQLGWTFVLLLYALLASALPVWLLLQPRDYLNSFQLYLGLGLMYLGLFLMRETGIGAPAYQPSSATGAPPLLPFLFIIIACGAVSGFHSIAASGTTARQMRSEADARPIGYGAMLAESALAVIVILACVTMSEGDWRGLYSSWQVRGEEASLAARLKPFIDGGGEFVSQGTFHLLSPEAARIFLAVIVVAFALTTLDSATRLLRYNVEELGRCFKLKFLAHRWLAALLAVLAIGFFALLKVPTRVLAGGELKTVARPAGQVLWQLFGATNQLLACLALLTVSLYLFRKRKPLWVTLPPLGLLSVVVAWAMLRKLWDFWMDKPRQWALYIVGVIILALTVWLLIEGLAAFLRGRPPPEPESPPPAPPLTETSILRPDRPSGHDDPQFLLTSGPQTPLPPDETH